jgi:hypothetical protein
MDNILDALSKKHSTWLKYVISFGCNKELAEDFVQDMYIKIFDYSLKKDNDLMFNEEEVNYFFIYVTLKNMYFDHLRSLKKTIKVEINCDFQDEENDYNEEVFNYRESLLNKWIQKIDIQIYNIKEYNDEKSQLYYIKFIFEKVFVEKKSISELSKVLGISYWSIRNTAKIIKNQIKNEK